MAGLCTRRKLLHASGITVASMLVAGCSVLDAEESGLVLGDISVRNGHADAHTVRVELERNDDVVHETTVDVDGGGGVELIEATWPATPAIYTLRYVISGPSESLDIHTRTLTGDDDQSNGHDCTVVAITMGSPEGSDPYVNVGTPDSLEGRCPE